MKQDPRNRKLSKQEKVTEESHPVDDIDDKTSEDRLADNLAQMMQVPLVSDEE